MNFFSPATSLLIDNHQIYECGRIPSKMFCSCSSGLEIKHWVLWGGEGGGGLHLWCKCCANVVVPLVTVKGQNDPLQCIFGVGKGPLTQLVFHWTPDKQFCAHNKDFTHENLYISVICLFYLLLLTSESSVEYIVCQWEHYIHFWHQIWIWNLRKLHKERFDWFWSTFCTILSALLGYLGPFYVHYTSNPLHFR